MKIYDCSQMQKPSKPYKSHMLIRLFTGMRRESAVYRFTKMKKQLRQPEITCEASIIPTILSFLRSGSNPDSNSQPSFILEMHQLKELIRKCWQVLCPLWSESNTETEPKTEVTLPTKKLTGFSSGELLAEMDLTSPSSTSIYPTPAKKLRRSSPVPSHEELLAQRFSNTNEEQASKPSKQTYPRQSEISTTTLEQEPRPSRSIQKNLFSKLRKMLYFILAEAPPTKALLLDLPLELLDYIVYYLPLPSKACLALCNKGLYQLYCTALKDNQLRFPRMPLIGRRYILTDAYHHRMTLLMQLENRHWACCGRCQKLHPCREFYPRKINTHGP